MVGRSLLLFMLGLMIHTTVNKHWHLQVVTTRRRRRRHRHRRHEQTNQPMPMCRMKA